MTFRAHTDNSRWCLYLRILNLITSAKTFFPNKVTGIDSGDYDMDIYLFWGHHSAYYGWNSTVSSGQLHSFT